MTERSPETTLPRLPLCPDENGFHFFGSAEQGWSPVFWYADLQRFDGGAPGRGLRMETMEEACGPYLGRAVLVTEECTNAA